MRALVQGAVAGYGIAIPVGPIAVLIVDRGLRGGFRQSFAAGLGAATADLGYALTAALVGAFAAQLLAPVAGPLRIVAALALAGFAGRGLWRLRRATSDASAGDIGLTDTTAGRTFASVLGLTLLNPITVTYFAALVLGGSLVADDTTSRLLFVAGAFAASLSWQTLLAGIGALGRRRLSPRARTLTGLLGNLVVLGLALRMLVS